MKDCSIYKRYLSNAGEAWKIKSYPDSCSAGAVLN